MPKYKLFIALFLFLLSKSLCSILPNTVIATINTGVTPAGLAITPDSKFAYVANNNNYTIPNEDTVSVLNLTNNTLEKTITDSSFNEPYTVTISPTGTKAYITNSNSTTITIIDIKTNTVIGIIDGFDGPSGMAIMPNGKIAYVNNYGADHPEPSGSGNTISIVNLNTNTIVGTITLNSPIPPALPAAPAALTLTPDGKFLYVANYVDGNPGTGTVSVIKTSNNTIVDTIHGFSGPFAITITPNGKYAYVTNFGSNNFAPYGTTVSVIDLSNNTVTSTVGLGIQPSGIAVTPDGKLAYASNYNTLYAGSGYTDLTPGQGTVNIIDIATNTLTGLTIAVNQSPSAVAISPNGEYAYVSNFISNTVNVIALQSFYITASGSQIQNRYLTGTSLVNKLTWVSSGTSLPVSYSIYRDQDLTNLAGTVSASEPLMFYDYNIKPNTTYTYYIIGTNRVGTISEPIKVTIN